MADRWTSSGRPLQIVVVGMLAADPHQGGATWAVLQYVLGLRQLGHDVVVVDPIQRGPIGERVRTYFDDVVTSFGLEGRCALIAEGTNPHGLDSDDLGRALRRADLLVDLSGRLRNLGGRVSAPVRVYVDLDPGFTQIWAEQGADVGLDDHTHFVTVGTALAGGGDGPAERVVPSAGVEWNGILPPVVLEHWPRLAVPQFGSLTTVANWRSYGSVEYSGRLFGQKAHSFRDLAELPLQLQRPVDLALDIHPGDVADRDRLVEAGWRLVDPLIAAGSPSRYQRFVGESWAEMGVAKSGYVTGRTGWVSDRTACYLASGRPAVLQDTGITGPLGDLREGIITFGDLDGAVDAIGRLELEWDRHARAARAIAEEHFDARIVLGGLLDEVMV